MITALCPFYNEIRYVEAWHACMSKFADEIICLDTGSDDGTREYLASQGVNVFEWDRLGYDKWNKDFNEWAARSFLLNLANGDWITTFDMDELIDDRMIAFIRGLPCIASNRKIVRAPLLNFWGDMKTLRVRSLWPPFTKLPNGKWRLLRNYRGQTGTFNARIFKNDSEICYTKAPEHTMIHDGRGRMTYRDKSITLDIDIPVFHLHYAFASKNGENRSEERGMKVKTKQYEGNYPKELELVR